MSLQKTLRFFYIGYILNRYNLSSLISDIPLFRFVRWFNRLNPMHYYFTCKNKNLSRGVRLRLALETLGPIFIKVGQALSTRPDIIPEDILDELCKLQDQAPPFCPKTSLTLIDTALNQKSSLIFKNIEATPIASASVAQVHAAELKDGTPVIIKILRPNLRKIILKDTSLMLSLAKRVEKHLKSFRRFHPVEIVNEIQESLLNELDLMREAANASQLKRNLTSQEAVYIPSIYWDYCRENVLVMEKITGLPSRDIKHYKDKVNVKYLAEKGVELFYAQVFRDCFFHADMHPGNVFFNIDNPEKPSYILVDFGIVGTLSREDQYYLAKNFIAFFKRDYRRVAELHIESGWVNPNARVEAFEAAIRTVCEPIYERPIAEISLGQTLLRLFQIARQFDMEIQPQLILLQKTLINIEGMGQQLYPNLNLWETAKPFLENWMEEQIGFKGFTNRMRKQMVTLSEHLPNLPEKLFHLLDSQTEMNKNKIIAKFNNMSNSNTISGDNTPIRTIYKQHKKHLNHLISSTLSIIGVGCIIQYFKPNWIHTLTQIIQQYPLNTGIICLLVAALLLKF